MDSVGPTRDLYHTCSLRFTQELLMHVSVLITGSKDHADPNKMQPEFSTFSTNPAQVWPKISGDRPCVLRQTLVKATREAPARLFSSIMRALHVGA